MALFGQKNEEITALSSLRTAKDAYCGRLHEAESRNSIRLRSEDGREWLFAAEENALWLFPVLPHLDLPESELNGAKEISLPREQAALRKCEPEIEKIGVEGLFTVYRKPKVRFVMNVPGEGEMRFTGINADRTAEYLAKNGLAQFLAVYDIADCTGPVFAFRCLAGDTLISKEYSRVQVFREGCANAALSRVRNLSRRKSACSGKFEELMTEQEKYMKAALKLAHKAAEEGEVPVGAVVVCDGKIVGRGRNRRETKKNALHHAEIEAIEKACRKLGGWRLHRCDLYVTLEPCPMCAGAIINARIKTVYFGAFDPKAGSCGSMINLFSLPYNHQPELVSGLMEEECAEELRTFFRELRKQRKLIRKAQKFASDAGDDPQTVPREAALHSEIQP